MTGTGSLVHHELANMLQEFEEVSSGDFAWAKDSRFGGGDVLHVAVDLILGWLDYLVDFLICCEFEDCEDCEQRGHTVYFLWVIEFETKFLVELDG